MENVLKHKSGSYSGIKDFSKCPEIVFSELKKGLVRTLVENMCQFLLTKTCRYKSRSEKDKNQETAKTNEPNKHEVHTFYVLH